MSPNASGFVVEVSRFRQNPASAGLVRDVRDILVQARIITRLPSCKELLVELEDDVPAGATLIGAHRVWLPWGFARVATPRGLPKQPEDTACPAGLVRLSIKCVNKWTPGMGSHYGFKGQYWSVLAHVGERIIWDVRVERAE